MFEVNLFTEQVDKSRQQQIKRKVLQRQTEKKEEIEMSEFWGQWCKHLGTYSLVVLFLP